MGRKSIEKIRIKNPKKLENYLQRLIDTFKQHGTRKYTMETIASELCISKATLYQYFSSKDEMVNKVMKSLLQEVMVYESIFKDSSLPFEVRQHKVLALFSNTFSRMSTTFLNDIKIDYPCVWKEIEKFNERVSEVSKIFYENGVKNGAFSNTEIVLLVEMDKYFVSLISNIDFLEKNNLTITTALETFSKIKMHGMLRNNMQLN